MLNHGNKIKILFSQMYIYEHTGRLIKGQYPSANEPIVCACWGIKMDDSVGNEPGNTSRDTRKEDIKEETFDEFLSRAYNQLTPEEQVRIRQKY
jgi:hypothetical protein